MKRIHKDKIDTPEYYEKVWSEETNTRPYFDAVRQRALSNKVKEGDIVLDIGSGVYGTAHFIAEHLQHLKAIVHAIDYSYTAREIVLKYFPTINYILGDATYLPYRDEFFDVVVAGELIEHIENPMDLVNEMGRVCKPNGWVVISTVDTNCENAKKREYPEHIWEFEPQDLVDFFSKIGETEYKVLGDYHMIYCQRR